MDGWMDGWNSDPGLGSPLIRCCATIYLPRVGPVRYLPPPVFFQFLVAPAVYRAESRLLNVSTS